MFQMNDQKMLLFEWVTYKNAGCALFTGEEHTQDPFRWDFVGKNVAFMAVEGFVYFILNLLIQYRFFMDHW